VTEYLTPGVYKEEIFPTPERHLETGVPVFVGYSDPPPRPHKELVVSDPLRTWAEFQGYDWRGGWKPIPDGYVSAAVQGFFRNGGRQCRVALIPDGESMASAFDADKALSHLLDDVDLVCVPDIMLARAAGGTPNPADVRTMQKAVTEYCDRMGDRFAILDSLPGAEPKDVLAQRQGLTSMNAALYYPWVQVYPDAVEAHRRVPACGHVAGVYAATDDKVGVHKAPANQQLEGVVDLERDVTAADQETLNPKGVNCIRAFAGRGIRVWGARTLSGLTPWTYVNVRRLFITAARWIDRNLADAAFEPNTPELWARIERDLNVYFSDLYRLGALKGESAEEAFYVKCDEETNRQEHRDTGAVVTEIGLSPTVPNEFVVVRIIHTTSGVTIAGPTPAAS
jgi:hypothetical protein